jgi:HAD superfamily hydrolase (TIGR01509 family)
MSSAVDHEGLGPATVSGVDPHVPFKSPGVAAERVQTTSVDSAVAPQKRLDLEAIVAGWWTALDAAERALRSGAGSLGEPETGERRRRLTDERREILELLQGLARDHSMTSPLLGWLAGQGLTRQKLGLPQSVRACVFDLDGVLTTSATAHADAWAETLDGYLLGRADSGRREFIAFDRRREYELLIAGKPRREGARAFLASRGIDLPEGSPNDAPGDATVYGLANRKLDLLRKRIERAGVAAFTGSRAYLEAVKMLGLRVAVVSASTNTSAILQQAELTHLIDEQIDGNTIELEQLRSKPSPDTLLAACKHLRLQPDDCAAFETTPAGIAAARAAGYKLAVAVDRDGQTRALRSSDADLVVGDLAEIAGTS